MTITDQALSVPAVLRRYRLAAGLSQEALAERAGLSVEAISAIERGLRRPRAPTLRALGTALGLSPVEMATLEVAQRRTGRPRAVPPPPGVPVATTPLLGRTHDLAIVAYLLRVAGVRLLTLTGPGGVGKTRLALQATHEVAGAFADGVVWVDLAPLREQALVEPIVARHLGVREQGQGATPLRPRLLAALHDRRLLLLLDNCEHLPGTRALVDALLAACPGLSVVVTSRVALRLAGEQEYVVAPLGLPTPGATTAEDVEGAPATALFLRRARLVEPGLALSATTTPVIAALCRRLDGLPLAIELAAALVKVLPPRAMLDRLGDVTPIAGAPQRGEQGGALDLLAGGAWDGPDRQQTMRATIAWSHDLLDPVEQVIFRCLALFVGGWTDEAAAAVCPTVAGRATAAVLAALVAKSLVRRDATTAETEMPRYGMLETIREYALEQLQRHGEREVVERAYAAYFVAFAERAEEHLSGPEQDRWLVRVAREHDNLRATLRLARDHGEAEPGLRIMGALRRFWELHGHLRETLRWLDDLLPGDAGRPVAMAVRAKALHAGGTIAYRLAEYERAESWLGQSLAIYRELSDHRGIADALVNLGNVAIDRGDYARAILHYDESAHLYRLIGRRAGLAAALNNLAEVRYRLGQYAGAADLYDESLALYREVGDTWSIASVLNNLGGIALEQGHVARATDLYEQSLALRRELGNQPGIALVLGNLGRAALLQGDRQRAANLYVESLDLYRRVDSRVGIAQCLEGLAEVAAGQEEGHVERCVALYGAATVLREAVDAPLSPSGQATRNGTLAAARQHLGATGFDSTLALGRAWTLEQSVAAAMAVATPEEAGHP